jgi:hypothetical protein
MTTDNKRTTTKMAQSKTLRSIGSLVKAPKITEQSPTLIGSITIQHSDLETLVKNLKAAGGKEVTCSLAAWRKKDLNGDPYLSVSLYPTSDRFQSPFPVADDVATTS